MPVVVVGNLWETVHASGCCGYFVGNCPCQWLLWVLCGKLSMPVVVVGTLWETVHASGCCGYFVGYTDIFELEMPVAGKLYYRLQFLLYLSNPNYWDR